MFSDILKQLRKRRKMSQIELSSALGISRSAISMYESGDRMPDYDTMKAISNIFGVSMDYLYGRQNSSPTRIPVLGYVAAGIPLEAIEDIIDYEEIPEQIIRDGSEYFALQIKGQSMEPKISDGDVVIVRKQPDVDSGQIGIVCVNGNHATCKKVMKHPNGILLQPLNAAYEPTFYTAEQIQELPITILGRVVELRAKF